MNADEPLVVLKTQVLKMRHMAAQQEAMINLLPPDVPSFVATFARCSAALARTAALALDQAIELRLQSYDAAGTPQPPPRPRPRLVASKD
jgi:hypothetical protein